MKLAVTTLTIVIVSYIAIMIVLGNMGIIVSTQDGNLFASLVTSFAVVLGIMITAIVAITILIVKNDRKA